MESQPLRGLLVALIVEFMIDGAAAQGIQQIAADVLRELAAIDKNMSAGHAARANNTRREKAK
jgi:hypothetical protein